MNRILLAALFVATSALAGPYDQPYSIITGNKAVVAPGKHQVTIDLPPRKGFHKATQETFEIDAKACTRYNVAAELASTTLQDWKPIVRSEEAIGECRKKFKLG